MSRDTLESFLADSPVARSARVNARIVFRTGERTPAELEAAFDGGDLTFDEPATCLLVAGGQTIAAGKIEERDGRFCFVAKEMME